MSDDTAPMTIKAVPTAIRQAAVAAAKNSKQAMGEWAAAAFEDKIRKDAGNVVFPPGKPATPEPEPTTGAGPIQHVDFHGLSILITAISEATARPNAPKGLIQETVTTVRAQLRQARGLPPIARRAPTAKPVGKPPMLRREIGELEPMLLERESEPLLLEGDA